MEARVLRFVFRTTIVALGFAFMFAARADAAGYKTRNFTVNAPTPQLAQEIGESAEVWRRQLAIEWLGKEMPPWSKPCPIDAKLASGAGGATSFVFDRGQVFGWRMNIQGSRERILDSVLPHEVTHTIFASHFRQPLPRWADEGACTTVEHHSEIAKQERNLITYLKTNRGIPFKQMFAMKEYPQDVMPLYAQGHSTAQWLIEARGKQAFLTFLEDGMSDENWERAVHKHYGFTDLFAMQSAWNDWVKQGRPRLTPDTAPGAVLASNTTSNASPTPTTLASANTIPATPGRIQYQSPDDITPLPGRPAAAEAVPGAPVTVASATGSVYAEAAAKAERERRAAASAAPIGNPSSSIYDASRDAGVLRR